MLPNPPARDGCGCDDPFDDYERMVFHEAKLTDAVSRLDTVRPLEQIGERNAHLP